MAVGALDLSVKLLVGCFLECFQQVSVGSQGLILNHGYSFYGWNPIRADNCKRRLRGTVVSQFADWHRGNSELENAVNLED